ncbi:hypothetical protein [Polyangium jinanense]|uniref:Delta-60 repeat protein n=1 Tax=Polyangium jinanense TaxID=2829994 RepID=A0A9X3X2N6_9BACT|nr:hypothetical protein [Polyangium jinanense]MDC3954839.1 hypothetical protein [Polyangium jinanense]MDC3981390.1 hypothetical protein [Polyangium jinanense]
MRLSRSAISRLVVSSLVTLAGCTADSAPTERNETSLVGSDIEPSCPAPSVYAGRLDDTFGVNGMARVGLSGDDGGYFGLDVAGDRILAAGWGEALGALRFHLARLTMSGRLDPAFGDDGTATAGFAPSTNDQARAVAVGHQHDGGIVAMGWRDEFRDESANIALVHFLPDGSIGGAGFGTEGKSLIDLGGDEFVLDGLVLPDDKILVVGRRDAELFVARATSNGALDPTFASPKGYFTVAVGSSLEARSVALDASGRILVAGTADVGQEKRMVVIRATADGVLDPSFGREGVVVGENGRDERAVSVALSRDGAIVVAGDTGGSPEFVVRRFLADGSPDPAFGNRGRSAWLRGAGEMRAEDMVVLPGGGILVVGNAVEGAAPVLVRYTCDGQVDSAFGVHGILRVYLGEAGVLHTVRLHTGNRILLGGADVGGSPGPGTYGVVVRMWM